MSTSKHRVPRNRPCEECRQHRRKCNLPFGESRCERCTKQNLKCEFKYYKRAKGGSHGSTELDVSEMNANVEYLERQVQELELAIRIARAQMDISPNTSTIEYDDIPVFGGDTTYNNPLFEFNSLNPTESELSEYNEDYPTYGNTLTLANSRTSSSTSSSAVDRFMLTPASAFSDFSQSNGVSSDSSQDVVLISPIPSDDDKEDQNNQHTWSITMTKKGLTINTNVKSIQDLVSWGFAAIKILNSETHLSPFTVNLSEYNGDISLAVTSRFHHGTKELYTDILRTNQKKLTFEDGNITQPALIAADAQAVVSSLIETYFQCHNKQILILHRDTFLEEEYDPRSPLSSPQVMAICAFVCLRHCRHMPDYTSQELRELGEFFYRTARDLLEDIFDDHKHRHESMLTLMYLGMFRLQTLRVSEALSATTLAYTIAHDLLPEMMEMPAVDDKSMIHREMFKRQYFFVVMVENQLYHIVEKTSKDIFFSKLSEDMMPLPDEDEKTIKFIKLKNKFHNWMSDPEVKAARKNITQLLGKDNGFNSLSLKNYFTYQNIITELYSQLEPDFKLAADIDTQPTDEQISNADRVQLQTFIIIHVFYILINSLFLPRDLFSNNTTDDVPAAELQSEFANMFLKNISASSLERCLKSSSIVIALAEQQIRHNICRCCRLTLLSVPVEPLYLLLVIDLSMQLAKADRRPEIAEIGHQNLEKCVKLLKDSIFAPMHGVFMDEGRSTTEPSLDSPITQTLKERMEKMLLPFGINV
ncbi:hypothetical protein INT43_006685 [Umbelopsis isabellina]|uniref:Zn(2)-C6 fungal-type domain-containing protein n=1 Tax=Mortierella isabellina TaxID=91625 RepID=A0A8H7Q0H2_MORIS|nr:hypothetical protein INT43_006685 [Umbelopsis isabellina]